MGHEWARVERKREEVIAKLCVRLWGLGGRPCQAGARVCKFRPWKPQSLDQRYRGDCKNTVQAL